VLEGITKGEFVLTPLPPHALSNYDLIVFDEDSILNISWVWAPPLAVLNV